MDFITSLLRTRAGYDSIWVIVDRLTKVAHFIPVKTTYSGDRLAELYMAKIVCQHGVPKKIFQDLIHSFCLPIYLGNSGPPHKSGSLPPSQDHLLRRQTCRTVHGQDSLSARCAKEDCVRQRFPVYLKVLAEAAQRFGHQLEFQHSLPPSNRWSNRKSKSNP